MITILLKNVFLINFSALKGSVCAEEGGRKGRRQGGNTFLSVIFPSKTTQ